MLEVLAAVTLPGVYSDPFFLIRECKTAHFPGGRPTGLRRVWSFYTSSHIWCSAVLILTLPALWFGLNPHSTPHLFKTTTCAAGPVQQAFVGFIGEAVFLSRAVNRSPNCFEMCPVHWNVLQFEGSRMCVVVCAWGIMKLFLHIHVLIPPMSFSNRVQ